MTLITVTEPVTNAIYRATDEVARLGHDTMRAEHILMGLLALDTGLASEVMNSLGVDRLAIRARIEPLLPARVTFDRQAEYRYDASGRAVLENAVAAAGGWDAGERMTSAGVLLGILELDNALLLGAIAGTGVDLSLLRSRLEARATDFE